MIERLLDINILIYVTFHFGFKQGQIWRPFNGVSFSTL